MVKSLANSTDSNFVTTRMAFTSQPNLPDAEVDDNT